MKTVTRWIWVCALLGVAPGVAAQEPDEADRLRVDSLLTAIHAETTLQNLATDFLTEFILLVSGLTDAQRQTLEDAIRTEFAAEVVRADLVTAILREARGNEPEEILQRFRSGAIGELARQADAYQPTTSLNEFVSALGTPPRDRLQLMVQLAEAYGSASRDLVISESLQESAHWLVGQLGGMLRTFERLPDEEYEAAYRDRSLRLGLENMYELEPVSDEIVRSAIAGLGTAEGQWFVDAYTAGLSAAVRTAATRVAARTMPRSEVPPAPEDTGLHCQGELCGIWVDWEGTEPDEFNLRFGAPAALAAEVMDASDSRSFRIVGGEDVTGLTIRMRPTLFTTPCDVVLGTDGLSCVAIRDVRVEFWGQYRELTNPGDFVVQNRCDANGVLDVEDLGGLMAAWIRHALYTPEDDPPPTPPCQG